MQTLKRNQQLIKYKNFSSMTAKTDSSGNETGEYIKTYGSFKQLRVCISANRGEATERMFGDSLDYDKVLVCKDTDIDEYSLLWVDDLDETHKNDYIVRQIARSLNSVSIAIKKVSVS